MISPTSTYKSQAYSYSCDMFYLIFATFSLSLYYYKCITYIQLAMWQSTTGPFKFRRAGGCDATGGSFWWHIHSRWTENGIECRCIYPRGTTSNITEIQILYIYIWYTELDNELLGIFECITCCQKSRLRLEVVQPCAELDLVRQPICRLGQTMGFVE